MRLQKLVNVDDTGLEVLSHRVYAAVDTSASRLLPTGNCILANEPRRRRQVFVPEQFSKFTATFVRGGDSVGDVCISQLDPAVP